MMIKRSKAAVRDEDDVRAFYKSVGISPEVIELAIIMRRDKPVREHAKPRRLKAQKSKQARPSR